MGIGISTFTEIVGAGPSNTFDILGIKMFDSAEIRVHPTGSAIVRIGVQTQGQGHETTFAQIVADELGLPVDNIIVEHGDTDTAPYGLGTYASRSTPTAGAATAMASRKIREKARELAAHLLEVSADDLEWVDHKFQVKGSPGSSKTMQEIAFAAYTNHPQGMEAGLEAVSYYDPPNLTFPFGAYICVVDIDRGTGMVKIRRFLAIDDCGTVINPMIVEGQIHGGLAMGMAPALLEEISYDEYGNVRGGTFMDYLLPTSMETPAWETDRTVTPSPHHPFGAKGVGESATVGAPPAIVNAVVDALSHLGVRHIDIPITPPRLWRLLQREGGGPLDLVRRSARARRRRCVARVSRSCWRRSCAAMRPAFGAAGRPRALERATARSQGWVGGGCVQTSVGARGVRARAGRGRAAAGAAERQRRCEEEGIVSVSDDVPQRAAPWRSTWSRCCRRPCWSLMGDSAGQPRRWRRSGAAAGLPRRALVRTALALVRRVGGRRGHEQWRRTTRWCARRLLAERTRTSGHGVRAGVGPTRCAARARAPKACRRSDCSA